MSTAPIAAPISAATPLEKAAKPRLLSLDVYRGLVILAMLIVNNLGDWDTTGYFWKHADWREGSFGASWRFWWDGLHSGALHWYEAFTQLPIWRHCTLADYVMPSFMLIIGLAIPFSVASQKARGVSRGAMYFKAVKRGAMLVFLGWILCYFRDQFAGWLYAPPGKAHFSVSFTMDVLQLLGVGYIVARVLYDLPQAGRIIAAAALLVWHWAFLRFWPQGDVLAGTFTEAHNAVKYAYDHWAIWDRTTLHLGFLTIGWRGMLSVPPAAGTMLLGTVAGEWLMDRNISESARGWKLVGFGAALAVVGCFWALDLPFSKPRWTPCYLMWVSGVGFLVIAALHKWLDHRVRPPGWTYPLVVFGSNSLAAYWVTIMVKVVLLNTPRVTAGGKTQSITSWAGTSLKQAMGPWMGGWAFTALFVAGCWVVLWAAYRRRIFWKL